jgi:UDP-perosamine 4-acetyltransferase
MKRQVIGLGAGGHGKVVLEALLLAGEWEARGVLDPDPTLQGGRVAGVPVLGDDSLLPGLQADGVTGFFVGVGSVGDARLRQRLFAWALGLGLEPVTVVHPRAVVSPSARLGRGVCVLAGAVVNADAHLGDNVIVNTGALVEHDCLLADHAHVATGATLGGGVRVGAGAHIGLGACVREGLCIGAQAIVGAGAVVVAEVMAEVVVVGVPARYLRSVSR